jgi:hypothetical protein
VENIPMDDSLQVIAERLTRYVDELLVAREQRNALAIRGRTQMILRALERLHAAHANSALPNDLMLRIQREKARAEVGLPSTSADYQNVCWDCYAHGQEVIVDKRIDPVCKTCGWVQCPECGACRDLKFGGCTNRLFKGARRAESQVRPRREVAIEPSWKHADVFPIIARIIEDAHRELQRFIKTPEIATRLLQDAEARNLICLASVGIGISPRSRLAAHG